MNVMRIDPSNLLQSMDSLSFQASGHVSGDPTSNPGTAFKDYFDKAVGAVNNELNISHVAKTEYTKDDPNVSLSKVMIQMQKAEISLSALVTVRNKILEGYKTIMNMSV